jgi:predicted ATP-grasp superfamily ATP-dependent carboligase
MRILIINRWDDEFADYGRYVDHSAHQVAYVTIAAHRPMIPAGVRHVEIVADPADADAVVAAARRCRDAVGTPDMILALSEFDLLTAARTREELSVPGPGMEAALLVRDKVRMKQAVARAGIRVPVSQPVGTVREVAAFAREHGTPLVVKPRAGAASVGCLVLDGDPDGNQDLAALDLSDYEAEEFLAGPIWHVDGLMQEGKPAFAVSSRYINTCYEFTRGHPLGSVVQSGPLADQVKDFAIRCLEALDVRSGAFHLEVIEHSSGLVFLEVGARVGGGEIPFTTYEVYGVDLIGDWIRLTLGEEPRTVPTAQFGEHAGFLMLPEPIGLRLGARPSMVGRIPGLYREILPEPGHVFDGSGGYDKILGRFRYRGSTAETVERAIDATLAGYAYVLQDPGGAAE